MPSVSRYMSREPYRLGPSDSLAAAKAIMHAHGIRHLPVIEGTQLLGVISDNDVRLVEAIPGVDIAFIEVARILVPPITVWGEAPLDEVATLMADKKSDCVVVLGGHGVQGIFTASDALRALGEVLVRATA